MMALCNTQEWLGLPMYSITKAPRRIASSATMPQPLSAMCSNLRDQQAMNGHHVCHTKTLSFPLKNSMYPDGTISEILWLSRTQQSCQITHLVRGV